MKAGPYHTHVCPRCGRTWACIVAACVNEPKKEHVTPCVSPPLPPGMHATVTGISDSGLED